MGMSKVTMQQCLDSQSGATASANNFKTVHLKSFDDNEVFALRDSPHIELLMFADFSGKPQTIDSNRISKEKAGSYPDLVSATPNRPLADHKRRWLPRWPGRIAHPADRGG